MILIAAVLFALYRKRSIDQREKDVENIAKEKEDDITGKPTELDELEVLVAHR